MVEAVFSALMKQEGISQEEARRRTHLHICGGCCNWYGSKAKEAGFDPASLTAQERARIKAAIKAAFPDTEAETAVKLIHTYICG